MNICDLLKPELILVNEDVATKDEIIDKLVDTLNNDERIADLEVVRNAVKEREKIMSTGVGHGFAIPHAKTNGAKDIIAAFAKLKNPIPFEALDNQPVELVFLLVGKENMVAAHIKLLSRISRMMNNTELRENLLDVSSAEEVISLFEKEEENYKN